MDVYQNVVFKEKVPPRPPPPPSSSLSTSTLEEFFPAENTEADDTSQQWLYSFMEDCLSSTTNYNHSITTTHNHHQQPQHPKPSIQTPTVLPSSSKSRNKRRKFISEFPFEMITTELPPLLHDYHPFWLADSELLAPPKKIPNEGGTSSPLVETVVSEQKQLEEEEEEEEEEEDGEDEEEEEKGVVQPTEPRRCSHCLSQRTPQWRAGPLGPKTLCNACGVRFKSGRLLPEYRPAKSPTFESIKHSNSHKKVMEMRKMTLKLCSQ